MFRLMDGPVFTGRKGVLFEAAHMLCFFLFVLISSSKDASGFMNYKYAPEIKAAVQKFSALYKRMDAKGIASIYLADQDIVIVGAGKDQDNIGIEGAVPAYEKEFSFYKKINSLDFKINSMSSLGHICWISADVFGDVVLSNGSKSSYPEGSPAVQRKVA